MLHQAGKSGTSDIERGAGPLRFWTVLAEGFALAVRIHVPVLPVLSVAVHGEELLRNSGD